MLDLLFFPNDRLMLWLAAPFDQMGDSDAGSQKERGGSPGGRSAVRAAALRYKALAAWIESGCWALPMEITTRFEIPAALTLHATVHLALPDPRSASDRRRDQRRDQRGRKKTPAPFAPLRSNFNFVSVRPDEPLIEKAPGASLDLDLDQEEGEVMRLVAGGMTTGQIAARLHYRKRWVFYRVAAVKRACRAVTRDQVARRK